MGRKLTTVFTFKINSNFDQWLEFFDSKEAFERLSEFDIKPLYRGQSKQDPQKVIVIHLLNIVIRINEKLIGLKSMPAMKPAMFMELIIISLMTQLKQLDIMEWPSKVL